MKFVENDVLIEKEQDEASKICKHKITNKMIGKTRYRFCENCGMIAHEDESFAYCCGFEFCKCCS